MNLDIHFKKRLASKIIEKIRKKYKQELQIHFFSEKDMEAKDPLIKDILRNGKKLI